MDCQDDSDEHLCGLIKLNPDKYRKAYMPNSPSVNDTLLIDRSCLPMNTQLRQAKGAEFVNVDVKIDIFENHKLGIIMY